MIDRNDVHWYRDAIIYQLHVKSFFDSNNDGIGDFAGLTQKLDYVKDLGATAIWVMPFYPSPLRDDGYDISNYRGINPSYGSLRDFRLFVREAHLRGLRVITELVINHTSDQHPWFQHARAAKPGSAARNFYVWADANSGYPDAPIIFLDTEKSNWTFDDVAKAFYWHRFYSHQPDLNFDNPRVLEAVLDVMRFWLDMGVDGLRLDAIPYLIEREGTACENLPETHAIIRKIRATVDSSYPDRMLLAEANVWPEEAARYFGQGDECHMAFHFPLMPRIYMALAQEDRHPITDIMRQTPEIPETAQWAIFLRNHDEMTLAMVTDKERDYLWSFYAADRRARINLGIRRRLAPLLENDRRKIELLTSLLFSMPGAPVLYYGDEIGMGDNIYLSDRDGVRTPMQWSVDRNGGFSRADPARLFQAPIQDPVYGFAAVNVEAQLASPSSLLTWMRRMIAVRRSHLAFGRGGLRFLYPLNRKVLAYLREFDAERILCVVNISRAPQPVELDLAEFAGATPVELTAGSLFPPIAVEPYVLTLPAYGFFWFRLETVPAEDDALRPDQAPELFTLVVTGKLETVLSGRELIAFERTVAPRFLTSQRWFQPHGTPIHSVFVKDFAVLRDGGQGRFILPMLDVNLASGEVQTYFTPLTAEPEREDQPVRSSTVAMLRRAARIGLLNDAESSPQFSLSLIEALRRGGELDTGQGGKIVFSPDPRLALEPAIEAEDVRHASVETGNTTLILANRMVLKIYRRLHSGVHPEVEIGRFLTEIAHFANTPPLLGVVDYCSADGSRATLAIAQSFVRCQGDSWTRTLEALKRILQALALAPEGDDADRADDFSAFVPHMRRLGVRTAEMHKALATPTEDFAFKSEPLGLADVQQEVEEVRDLAGRVFARLQRFDDAANDETKTAAGRLLNRRQECLDLIEDLTKAPEGAIKIRIHGDYHLGRTLVVKDDVVIIGFGGSPSASFEQRRAKTSPLRDVASMLRSFAYVAAAAKRDVARLVPDPHTAATRLSQQLVELSQIFVHSYMETARGSPIWIEDQISRRRLLFLYLLAKAFHEIDDGIAHRSDWIDIAIEGVNVILDEAAKRN
ncbi:maltose alpha-D-glucosyltransferase [Methylocapsa palsarum]|uniref:maltose alpha-D-glucosyltransferase n=1 Tax=Methylocapsa palsarum TaxID=1612308 RepID=A0A1I3W0H5_9HYPH|nr:maltose alpha-D-glucosyltransferase [Methylocapsa palsarum]SFK00942.1 maltose alpha-D-glucosyltransferase/ alpha-amylase [Methylocapsa palsarum]